MKRGPAGTSDAARRTDLNFLRGALSELSIVSVIDTEHITKFVLSRDIASAVPWSPTYATAAAWPTKLY